MEKDIREKIENLKIQKEQLDRLYRDKRAHTKLGISTSQKELFDQADFLRDEYFDKAGETITVQLKDLIQELDSLTGIDMFSMGIEVGTSVGYWGSYNKNEIIQIMESVIPFHNWYINIYADKNFDANDLQSQAFAFRISFPLDLEELQYDGTTFLDHCDVIVKNSSIDPRKFTELIINKNIGKLKCNIKMETLAGLNSFLNHKLYPSGLLVQAVINCVEKEKINGSLTRKLYKNNKD